MAKSYKPGAGSVAASIKAARIKSEKGFSAENEVMNRNNTQDKPIAENEASGASDNKRLENSENNQPKEKEDSQSKQTNDNSTPQTSSEEQSTTNKNKDVSSKKGKKDQDPKFLKILKQLDEPSDMHGKTIHLNKDLNEIYARIALLSDIPKNKLISGVLRLYLKENKKEITNLINKNQWNF